MDDNLVITVVASMIIKSVTSLLVSIFLKECVYSACDAAVMDRIEGFLESEGSWPAFSLRQRHTWAGAVYERRMTRDLLTFVVHRGDTVSVYRWIWLSRLTFQVAAPTPSWDPLDPWKREDRASPPRSSPPRSDATSWTIRTEQPEVPVFRRVEFQCYRDAV